MQVCPKSTPSPNIIGHAPAITLMSCWRQYATAGEALRAFRKLRGTITEFAKSSQDDVRGRQLKGGNMDVYQWLLMISTHAQRHILQMREVKMHSGYPRR